MRIRGVQNYRICQFNLFLPPFSLIGRCCDCEIDLPVTPILKVRSFVEQIGLYKPPLLLFLLHFILHRIVPYYASSRRRKEIFLKIGDFPFFAQNQIVMIIAIWQLLALLLSHKYILYV